MKEAIHINYVMEQIDLAAKYKQRVRLKAWKKDGNEVDYSGWIPIGGHWRGGIHRLMNPVNKEVRAVIDVLIFEYNGHSVYL
ncbi:MAG: maintenance system killer protein [Prevotella sp.]|nr:maintenance system killer protein [Prevotella sp.]MBR6997394.1 maintenance system killer protein [Prevotella sp.]